jgi:hypothetical protein
VNQVVVDADTLIAMAWSTRTMLVDHRAPIQYVVTDAVGRDRGS